MSTRISFMGLELKNPIVISAGPWSRDADSIQRSIDSGAGAVITETITLEANPSLCPYIYTKGNSQLFSTKLFSHLHLEQWEQEFARLHPGNCKIIASIWGNSPSELSYLAAKLERMGADAIEICTSAPLGTHKQSSVSYPENICDYVKAVVKAVDIPVTVKLSYEAVSSGALIRSLERSGASAFTAIDALKGLIGVDLEKCRAMMPANGSYSGRSIHPIALASIVTLKQITELPICACGGVENFETGFEFIMMGASCFQMASVLLREGYGIITDTVYRLEQWMVKHNISSLQEICGAALNSLQPLEELQPQPLTARISLCPDPNCTLWQKNCIYNAISNDGKGNIIIDSQKCTGCGYCEANCPHKAIHLSW